MKKSFSLAFFFFPLYFPGTKHSLRKNAIHLKIDTEYSLHVLFLKIDTEYYRVTWIFVLFGMACKRVSD